MAVLPKKHYPRENLLDPNESRNGEFLAATIPFFVIMVIFYIARIYSRLRPVMNIFCDDVAITLAFVLEITSYAMSLTILISTGGKHYRFIPDHVLADALRIEYAFFYLTTYSNLLVKVSIALMLLRIKSDRIWKAGLWCLIVSMGVFAIGNTITQALYCHPVHDFWNINRDINEGSCWAPETAVQLQYGYGSYLALTDLVVALLPIAFVRHIRRPLREKIVLGVLMGMGILAMIAGIVKTVLYKEFRSGDDVLYDLIGIRIWLHLEIILGITAACVPCLKTMFDRLWHRASEYVVACRSRTGNQSRTNDHKQMSSANSTVYGFNSASNTVFDGSLPYEARNTSPGGYAYAD